MSKAGRCHSYLFEKPSIEKFDEKKNP